MAQVLTPRLELFRCLTDNFAEPDERVPEAVRVEVGQVGADLMATLGTGLSVSAHAATPQMSLCSDGEQVIFSCVVDRSGKQVSLCGAKELDRRRGYLQYRFGTPGAIELQFPRDRANTQRAFRHAHYFRAQVDRTETTFDNSGYRYVMYSYYDGDTKPVVREAGVRVQRHGTTDRATELPCRAEPIAKFSGLESILTRDNDNPLNR